MFDSFKPNSVENLTKKHEADITAWIAAKERGSQRVRERMAVEADVARGSHGATTRPVDQLRVVLAQRACIEAADEARALEAKAASSGAKLGIARKDPNAFARDPESLLKDLTKMHAEIATHETALTAARRAWDERTMQARAAFNAADAAAADGDAPRPRPLPAFVDHIGRPFERAEILENLSTAAKDGTPPKSEEQLFQLRVRERELRATIERQRREAEEEARRAADYRKSRDVSRALDEAQSARDSAAADKAARARIEDEERLAASHRAHDANTFSDGKEDAFADSAA